MHQSKKGNQWHFDMKMHIGANEALGVIYSLEATLANFHDITQTEHLLHDQEESFSGDAGFRGVDKREEMANKITGWNIAVRSGKRKQINAVELLLEKAKASICAKFEHPFRRI